MEAVTPTRSETEGEETETQNDVDDGNALKIPDGGWGWMVCFAGFMVNFTYVGLTASNGIISLGLIDLYGETVLKSTMVTSIFMGIAMTVGPFVLLLMMFNASHRQVIIYGGFLSAMATIGSFFVREIEVLYATYGLLSGCLVGMSFFAGNTIVGSYFKKKRTLAVGIAHSGGGIGAFALNYLIERSIYFYGMRGTFLLISGLLLNFIVYGALCRPLTTVKTKNKKVKGVTLTSVRVIQPETNFGFESDEIQETSTNTSVNSEQPCHSESVPPTTKKTHQLASKCNYLRLAIFDPDVMKNSGMQLLLCVYFLRAMCEVVLLYLPVKAEDVGLSREEGALVMSIYGTVFAFSQIAVGVLADMIHIPTTYILMVSLLGMSGICVAITFCHTFTLFVLAASLFAICKGFGSALKVVFVASILGVKKLNHGYSPLCLLIGLAQIIYPFISGSLFEATQSFDYVFYLAAGFLFMSFILSSGLIYMQRKSKFCE